ncbi:hypothetical protein PR202_gb28826 [Eleusine coracana subsp. coracana]|uniref:Uncharacterized protein n=1 Tax=Eleusine coracana subsp. coracana TaxID=191504 RepID=A0AAV5FZU7_ELECO|nr:hypothetical protein PR202_gb28826 [Eleusine coracana subsp. coracana]
MAHFLWDNVGDNHKYHLANWELVTQKKEYGGLGVPDLRSLNRCLLASWIARYYKERYGLWKLIVEDKYEINKPNLFCCKIVNLSPFMKGVIWAAEAAKVGFKWQVNNEKSVKFWEDWWFGNSSLAVQYWDLYKIVNEKEATIEEVWDGVNLKFTFRRTVSELGLQHWRELVNIASSVSLNNESDAIIWTYDSTGKYSVQSLYAVITFRGVQPVHSPAVWNLNIPP